MPKSFNPKKTTKRQNLLKHQTLKDGANSATRRVSHLPWCLSVFVCVGTEVRRMRAFLVTKEYAS